MCQPTSKQHVHFFEPAEVPGQSTGKQAVLPKGFMPLQTWDNFMHLFSLVYLYFLAEIQEFLLLKCGSFLRFHTLS